jgi:hypothetical protein
VPDSYFGLVLIKLYPAKESITDMIKTGYRSLFGGSAGLAALVIILFALSGCEDPGSYGDVDPVVFGRLQVHQSSSAPPMNDVSNDIWFDALTGGIYVSDSAFVADSADSVPVSLKAIKTASHFYLRASWGETPSVLNRTYSVWQQPVVHLFKTDTTWQDDTILVSVDTVFDTWNRRSLKVDTIPDLINGGFIYDTTQLEQDRFAVIWDVGNNGAEQADCRSMCHIPGDVSINGHRMFTTGGGNVDVWHWQAGTTDPVRLAQDEYWSADGRIEDAATQEIFSSNYDTINLMPIYVHQDSNQVSREFLYADETIPFDPARTWADGVRIPGYILHEIANVSTGSNADIDCFSTFNRTSGRWTVLMRRALDTTNDDDIDFSSIASGDSVMASIAFMDHSDTTHYGSRPFYIIFP